jgi:predicted ATPase/class 3 adenylate cyclase
MRSVEVSEVKSPMVSTPDRRLRVFVSSAFDELEAEREAARTAISASRLTPLMSEPGTGPHPPAEIYRAYVERADVFVGIYWQSYGWAAPGSDISAIEDEFELAAGRPRLLYVKVPAPIRDERLEALLEHLETSEHATYRHFRSPQELRDILTEDLAILLGEGSPSDDTLDRAGTLVFLFADLEGSTSILKRLGERYPALLGRYHQIVTAATIEHDGRVVTTEGDGFFCVFGSPTQAVDAAQQTQSAMAEEPWPADEVPRCRIGIHTGSAARTAEGYIGMDVHVAARIGAAAQGGQILLSSAMSDLVSSYVDGRGWMIVDLGQYELSGIGRSERLHRLDIPGLDVVSRAPRARPRIPSVVPSSPRPIVGRVEEVREASEILLRDRVRLLTLTGPGGTGKTRLAVELTSRLESEFPDGIVFVDLSAVRDVERFLPVVGRALGVHESGDRTIPSALSLVLGDARMLLVLDNMEQIIEAAPHVIEILQALPNVKVLVTSRSPLQISWEHEYPVPPLSLPGDDADLEELTESGAVALFMERTLAVRPYFKLQESTRQVVVDIVQRLDGLPLAIELAAARLRVFTVEELRDRLDHRLGVLDRSTSDAPPRHRTLRSAIQWSYDLLEPDEQVVFRRLAVFSGGWVLAGALAVCVDDDLAESRVLDVLESLVARSLVVFSIDERGRPRYRQLETLREFGVEEMEKAGEEPEIRLRHLRWCRSLADRMTEILPTVGFPAFLDELELERFNIREALAWSVGSRQGLDEALMVGGMLPLFWDTRGYVSEGLRWIRTLIAMTTADGVTFPRAMAHTSMGWLEMLGGDGEESTWAFKTAVRMFRELDDREWLGRALAMAGMTSYNRGDPDTAELEFVEAIELNREYGLDWLADGWCEYGLAHVALQRGDVAQAERRLHNVLDFSRRNGLTWGIGHSQLSLAALNFTMGDHDQSVERTVDSLRVRKELRDARGLCDCIGMMALHASVKGDHELAATLLGAAEVAREAAGYSPIPWLRPLLDQARELSESVLGEDYETVRAGGHRLTVVEAIELIVDRFAIGPADGEPTQSSSVGD